MKKMLVVLAIVVTMLATMVVPSMAEEKAPVTIRNGVTFDMNMDQVMATETGRYEIDTEHTRGGVTFTELEYENTTENGVRADVKYLFVGNELAAVRVDYDDNVISYDRVKADLTARYGDSAAVDKALLGKGIYAVDDDGKLEYQAEAFVFENLMIILEQDDDDLDVTYVNLNASYLK